MSIERFYRYLPCRFAAAAARLPEELIEKAFEIRLRLDAPASLSLARRNVPFNENGVSTVQNAMRATRDEMEKCLMLICDGSLYSHEHTIKNGYVSLQNGRAGICGDAVTDESGHITSFKSINSISLRCHSERSGFAKKLITGFASRGLKGTLIYSPPMMGKTTLLRSVCKLLSCGIGIRPYRVGIVDERKEICINSGITGLADVISGCGKAKSIEMLTRTMAPEVIACDELTCEEARAVEEAQNTGVYLIATAHAENRDMLLKREFIAGMISKGIFGYLVRLYGDFEYDIENVV